MGGKWILLGWTIAGVVLVGGCSGKKNPPHLGENPTFGQECSNVWTALCQRGVADCSLAALGATPKDCVDKYATACCGNQCNTIAGSTQGQVDKCDAALSDFSCDALAHELPPECQGVIHY